MFAYYYITKIVMHVFDWKLFMVKIKLEVCFRKVFINFLCNSYAIFLVNVAIFRNK